MSNSQCLFHKGVVYEVSSYTFEYIEGDVARLLRDFEHARQIAVDAPVPIEDIVEKHLKLRVDFDDIHRLLGISRSGLKTEILGAIFPNEAWIVIDESLDPELYPAQEAHYRFTLAHEGGGHWRLHRDFLTTKATEEIHQDPHSTQGCLFGWPPERIVHFRSRSHDELEVEADQYALRLLMPRDLVYADWEQTYPDRQRRLMRPLTIMADGDADIPGSTRHGNNTQALELFCRPFAERFKVSTTHMMHRLLGLGLILLEIPEQLELFPDIWPPALVASPFQQGACCLVSSRQVTELVLYRGGL